MSDDQNAKPVIKVQKDGYLQVKGLERFCNSRGEAIETRSSMALCRCGQSKEKPFCDMSHETVGFTGEKKEDRQPDRLDVYEGKDITILDNRGICSHAGFCTAGLPRVWRQGTEPWIDPDGAPVKEIIEVIERCPSGALSYRLEGKTTNSWHDDPEIQVARHGPYYVRGGVELKDDDMFEGLSGDHYALCRCGHSNNKPFCDGSHWYAGFRDLEGRTISEAARSRQKEGPSWVDVGKESELAADEIHPVSIGPRKLLLVKHTDQWHAMDARCPHQGGPLTEGRLHDGCVRCPWHGYDFEIETGKGVGNDFTAEVLDVQVEDGMVQVEAPDPAHSNWTVSHVVAETLVNWGVDTVFGMVGHSNLGLAEGMRIMAEKGALRYFGIRHEGAASFACSGYAKVSNRPAACLSIAGPGATNLLTGLWDARVDRAPVLALTGQVNTQVLGPGAFQEIDLASAFAAVAEFSQTVLPDSDHAELTNLALKSAVLQRNVAHLIFPDEVQTVDAGMEAPGEPDGRLGREEIAPPEQSLAYAVYRIQRARRPVIIVGYGARNSMENVVALAEALGSPIITTFKAKGQISDSHPHGAGVLGRSGTPVASWFMNQADLLLVFGASFSNHTGITTNKPIIQVDFDRMALGKFHPVDEPVWGEIGITAGMLLDRLAGSGNWEDQTGELTERWASWREDKRRREQQDNGDGINSALVFKHLQELVPEDAVLPVDVGNNTYSFGRYFECARQSVIMSGYLGSIGFGFPAAMGAWAAVGDKRKVVSISGDGGFGQYMGEFLTAVKYDMDITHILLNNDELAKISKEQREGEWPTWQTGLHNPSFAEYAEASGGWGRRVTDPDELRDAMAEALEQDGPSLVEIITDPLLT